MIGLGLGVAVGQAPAVAAGGAVSNLLRWTEQFDNAVWVVSGVTVLPNAVTPPTGLTRADQLSFDSEGSITQASLTAAATGASAALSPTISTEWTRFSHSGTFDGLAYTFSIYLQGLLGEEPLTVRMFRSAGVINFQIFENAAIGGWTVNVSGAQLELGGSAGTYTPRTT